MKWESKLNAIEGKNEALRERLVKSVQYHSEEREMDCIMKKPGSFDEAILNVTKGRTNIYGDVSQKELLYSPWDKTYAKTLGEFYNDFIAPRLPDPHVVLKWHEVITYYAEQPGVIFPVRAGNQKTKLRRGWLVNVNENFSYMFTDNDLAVYIYKMALDGFCPDKDTFVEYMTEFKSPSDIGWLKAKNSKIKHDINADYGVARKFLQMPARFNRAGGPGPDALETQKNAYINTGPAPACCLGTYNYKHAHIIDVAGKDYEMPGKTVPIKWESIKDSLLGAADDYRWDVAKSNYVWNRTMPVAEEKELKALLKAHLFRFIDPLNHFLAPMSEQSRFINEAKVPQTDIAEYENLQKYIIKKKIAVFASDFDDFIKWTCAPKEWCDMGWTENGSEEINVVYHEKSLKKAVYGEALSKFGCSTVATSAAPKASGKSRDKYSDKSLQMAVCYLKLKNGGLVDVEEQVLGCNSNGSLAKNHLNKLGIDTSRGTEHKGLLLRSNIDDEIAKASDIFKTTLEEIKKRGL